MAWNNGVFGVPPLQAVESFHISLSMMESTRQKTAVCWWQGTSFPVWTHVSERKHPLAFGAGRLSPMMLLIGAYSTCSVTDRLGEIILQPMQWHVSQSREGYVIFSHWHCAVSAHFLRVFCTTPPQVQKPDLGVLLCEPPDGGRSSFFLFVALQE